MIRGLEVFKKFFHDFQDQYVLIGGAACDIIFHEANLPFRATKDLDMVLIIEALTPEFGKRFWDFIKSGGYENRVKSNGMPQFYRFDKPKSLDFPYMIELFARSDSVFDNENYGCRPLHLGEEISSLSAILMNQDYYQLLISGKVAVSDITILPNTFLILFKAKAWLDLTERKALGQKIDEKDIRKHKNDVARLAVLLTGNEACTVPANIYGDMVQFIAAFGKELPDVKSLGIAGVTGNDIADLLKKIYNTDSQ